MATLIDPPITVATGPGSTQVATAMQQVASNSIVVQVAMNILLHQPDIVLTELPSLPVHQQTARTHADTWFRDINPVLITTIADIIDFANNWKQYSDPLYVLADQLHTDPGAKAELNNGLDDLINLIKQKKQGAAAAVALLVTFRQELEEDGRNFTSDQQKAELDILGDNGTLTNLNEDLKTYQNNRNQAIGEIAGGSTAALVGGIMVVVGVVAVVTTAGLSTPVTVGLIGGGLAIAGAGVALTVVGVKALQAAETQIADTQRQINEINQSVTALTHVDGQIKALSQAVAKALESVQAMEKGWDVLSADFTELSKDVADTKKVNWVKPKLQATGLAWQQMQKDAIKLQAYGRLDVQVSTDLSNRQN